MTMPSFRYTAMTSAGTLVKGEIDGRNHAEAIEQLQARGYFPITAKHSPMERWRLWLPTELGWRRGVPLRDLANATHELATLLNAGLPLDRAVEILLGLTEMRSLRRPFASVLARLRDGATLADALAASGDIFRKCTRAWSAPARPPELLILRSFALLNISARPTPCAKPSRPR